MYIEQKRIYVLDMAALTMLSVHHSIKIEDDHTHAPTQQLFNEARCSDTAKASDCVFCYGSASELHLVDITEARWSRMCLLQDLLFERGRGIGDLCAMFSFGHCLAPIASITISIKGRAYMHEARVSPSSMKHGMMMPRCAMFPKDVD